MHSVLILNYLAMLASVVDFSELALDLVTK